MDVVSVQGLSRRMCMSLTCWPQNCTINYGCSTSFEHCMALYCWTRS